MADLSPLAEYPTEGVSPELVGQLEHSANWARTFGGANTTNIAQRYRHNQDIEAYAGALQQQRRQAQEEALLTDKRAQDLFFGMRRLDLQEEEARTRMQHNAELHPLKVQAQKTQIAADLARERAATQAAEFKSKAALQEQDDDDAFHATLNKGLSQGIKIGTPEWAELVAGARLAAPAMKSEIFDDVWKATSRSPLTPQEAIDQAVAKKKALMDVQPVKPAKSDTYDSFNKDLDAAKKAYGVGVKMPDGKISAARLPDFIQKAFEDRGRRLEGATTEQPKQPDFKNADDVKAAFKSGIIPRDEALKLLKEKFNHT